MAFSSSLSIEQVTFDADDTRCSKQNINSFESLVNFDSEFPKKESFLSNSASYIKNKFSKSSSSSKRPETESISTSLNPNLIDQNDKS